MEYQTISPSELASFVGKTIHTSWQNSRTMRWILESVDGEWATIRTRVKPVKRLKTHVGTLRKTRKHERHS